jgi:rare lipoprotein A
MKINILNILFISLLLLLSGCSTVSRTNHYPIGKDGAPNFNIDASKIPDAVPKEEPRSKYGNPSTYKVDGQTYTVLKSSKGYCQTGIASWYGMKFDKQLTSNRERYDVAAMTAASKVLPLPTYVQVTNLQNGKKVIVKVNDRGPFRENRIIDLSFVAAKKLGVFPKGTALVEVRAIDPNYPVSESTTSVPPQALGHPEIYIQLGAFGVEQNADNLENKVKQLTKYPVLIKTVDKDGKSIYKVQIGPIPSVDNTDTLHDTLQKEGLGESITVIQ